MYLNYLASLGHFVPELIVCVTMFSLILLETTYRDDESERPLLFLGAFIGLVSAFIYLMTGLKTPATTIFTGSLAVDSFGTLAKIIMVLGTMGAAYLAKESKDIARSLKAEFVILSLGVLVGGMLLASATNMLIVYIGIETLSILSYVMASLRKDNELSAEAGLKYALYGGISAGVMLFGISHIFGVLGTINFFEMASVLKSTPDLGSLMFALVPAFLFFLVGIGYKIACVPFHMWAPDVYEGSPLPVTAFFSIVPKVAGIAAFVRISDVVFSSHQILNVSWMGTLSVVAALTMTVGNVSAIGQRSVKRMLAYSSISHAGVMLLGVLVMDTIGMKAVLFYGFTYLFMTLVAFYVVSFVQDNYGNDHFDRFSGLAYRYPVMAIVMAMTMFSLAGIPPLSGFVAKFHIFTAVINEGHITLAIIAGLNSVISLYYYLKIVRLMVFKSVESNDVIAGFGVANQGIIIALSLPVLFLGIFWSRLMELVSGAFLLVP